MEATYQAAAAAYAAIVRSVKHIMNVSVTDLKRNYANLNVDFDLWKGESDAQPYIPDMVQKMKDEGFAYDERGCACRGCQGGYRYQGDPAVHDPEVRRCIPVYYHRPGNDCMSV